MCKAKNYKYYKTCAVKRELDDIKCCDYVKNNHIGGKKKQWNSML